MQQNVLASLQQLLASTRPAQYPVYSFSKLKAGIPRGAITEISGPHGSGKTETVLRFLAENEKLRIAWIEDQFTAYPCSFPQFGVKLDRILFVESGRETLWATHQILRSRIFNIVVLGSPRLQLSEVDLRRLQLSTEQSRASLILLTDTPALRGAWPISLQAQMQDRKMQVLKQRSYL